MALEATEPEKGSYGIFEEPVIDIDISEAKNPLAVVEYVEDSKEAAAVGLVAMLLACKYEEVSVPVVDDLVFISDKAYSRSDILEMIPKGGSIRRKTRPDVVFLMELCLVEYETVKFSPSFLAAASVYTAQCSLYGLKQWSRTCEWYTSYSEEQLVECSRMIVELHQRSNREINGVYRKLPFEVLLMLQSVSRLSLL
uniref:Putative cyclin family protein n=1 Tax=Helianthus annuus TaxID=4232 RepID=A0A251U9X1_HELAN